jgi:protein-disulfide isomerase
VKLEKLSVPIAIIIAGALIAVSLYYSNAKNPLVSQQATTPTVTNDGLNKLRPISNDDHILGNPSADVIIVEYSDTECPFCKVFHSTLQRVMDEYGKDGKVAWVYRHFPIDDLHSRARKEAEATECANELGGPSKFWEFTNLVYTTTNSNNTLDPAELPKIAKSVGLDVTAFNTCLSSGKYANKVDADYQNAILIGGRGTPTSVLIAKDGTKTMVEGAQPYENLKTLIDAML